MKKIVKKNYEILVGIVIGIIISTTVTYGAENILTGSDVSYNTETSHGSKNNIQGAIDELYEKANLCSNSNKNIVFAYTYSESGNNKCINGEENTCQKTECYKDKNANSCSVGTIIKYRVKENEEHYFYVLHDDGDKITMQQRENIIKSKEWYKEEDDNWYGPETILPELEDATKTWTNVNVIEYQPGVTILYENQYTGCSISGLTCNYNKYTMSQRKARARMITFQEAKKTGCTVNNVSCPEWLYNYLYKSTSYDGSYDDTSGDYGYWTMSASNGNNSDAWLVRNDGCLAINQTMSRAYGARAVVEINK